MENCRFSNIAAYDDVSTIDNYKTCVDAGYSEEEALEYAYRFSRDNARTPVQWSSADNAGFTAGTPWMRVNPNYRTINVEAEQADPNSVYAFYKELIQLYKDPAYHGTFTFGKLVPFAREQKNLIAYERQGDGQKLLIAVNFQKEPQTVTLPMDGTVVLNNLETVEHQENQITLQEYQAIVMEEKTC